MNPNDVQELVRRVRQDLGAIRSCALMMVNAQNPEVRTKFLLNVKDKLTSIEALLDKLQKSAAAE